MGLSGSDVAYRWAIADDEPRGKVRADTTRAGHFLQDAVHVNINGARRSGVIQSSIRIDLNTGAEPNRCSFDLKGGSGYVPVAGHEVVIGHGTIDNRLFAGRLRAVTRAAIRNDDKRPVYRCDAVGYVFEIELSSAPWGGIRLNSLSPRSIVPAVIGVTSPSLTALGFTADIDPTLETFAQFNLGPHQSITAAFADMFRTVDAVWTVDNRRVIRAWSVANSATVPSTITSSASNVWALTANRTDLSRIYTRVSVRGARTTTLADVDLDTQVAAPIASPEGLYVRSILSSGTVYLNTGDIPFLIDDVFRDSSFSHTIDLFNAGNASVFLPSSRGTNTLTIVSANVGSVKPIDEQRWYGIGGQYVYVASLLGLYSITANSVAYNYWVPSGGPGALVTDIGALSDIAPVWNHMLGVSSPSITATEIVPAGANVTLYATGISESTVRNEVSSLFGSASYGPVHRTFDDEDLTAGKIKNFTSAALARGYPGQWQSLEFTTRERAYNLGVPAFVSITSPAEPSGHSIVGTYTVQDVTIGGFGRLTPTQGPERTVRVGEVRRPTLWQVLQGDR